MKDSTTHIVLAIGAVLFFGAVLVALSKGHFLNPNFLRQFASEVVSQQHYNY